MTADRDLATIFGESGSEIITHENRTVRAFVRIEVPARATLEITRLTASRRRPQAMKISANVGELVVDGSRAPTIALWADTSPRKVLVTIDNDERTTVDLWNAWRYGGADHAWLGNAGIVVQAEADHYTLQCSDGVGAVDFTDLVVTVRISPDRARPAGHVPGS
ncbi:MAG: hypothetical protein OEU32_03940 [Acidimicrobiia bacterium]|nr:hypothetical protein [Acidimicrobiia bacterium]